MPLITSTTNLKSLKYETYTQPPYVITQIPDAPESNGFQLISGLPPLGGVGGNVNLLSLKNNFIHLIHQAGLSINGKTAEDVQPYINVAKHFQMLSEMSVNDLATVGYTLGFGETIDNHRSVAWNGNATDKNGNGFMNQQNQK
jgi:hypothetical protein